MNCQNIPTPAFQSADAAFTELRKKGLAAASRKTSRTAAEGLVAVSHDAHSAVIVELNSETDFVARNPKFQALVQSIAEAARTAGATEEGAGGAASVVVPELEVGICASCKDFGLELDPCIWVWDRVTLHDNWTTPLSGFQSLQSYAVEVFSEVVCLSCLAAKPDHSLAFQTEAKLVEGLRNKESASVTVNLSL